MISIVIFTIIVQQLIYSATGCYYNVDGKSPCKEKYCAFGTQCTVSANGQKAECVCPTKCPYYGDSRESRPVCGSDGKDYPNLCELNRYACTNQKDVFVRYNGSCDPCYGVKCPASQICQIDEYRHPICKCNAACGKEFEPVCGSDGNTYINECVLRVEACRSRKSLRILHQDSCSETNACKSLKCSHYQECEVNRYGIAICQCPASCSKIMKPVCGTDGNTYDSECELKRQACIQHKNISIRYIGICDFDSFCHKNHGICKFGSLCVVHKNTNYTCLCPKCSQVYDPVCGSNGITYISACKFREDMCQKKRTNVTFHEGPCVGCESMNCQFYSRCETSSDGGKCVCPSNCEKIYDPVCGSDLVTYGNECELRENSCKKREHITAIKRGPCNSCHNVHCDYGARCENGVCVCPKKCPAYIEHVCGSNNVTYDNQCKLMSASCDSVTQITVQSKGSCVKTSQLRDILSTLCEFNTCKYGGICIIDNKLNNHCFCNFNCSYSSSLVERICGSDGRIYENECIFQEEMCNRQQEIRKMKMLYCEKFRKIPCQGEPPLVNPVTRKEYDCSKSSCPRDSYCHKDVDFAKCCSEVDFDEDCNDTPFGCCADETTPALGPKGEGCPDVCQCNRLGAYLFKCDPSTRQCYCKPGVGGLRCERCEPGYWGLHKISEGNSGCIPCQCNQIGSSRDDCEQMTGRCVCKPGFSGSKCDLCANRSAAEFTECTLTARESTNVANSVCTDNRQCHFGSICDQSKCVCKFQCPLANNSTLVCASDGNIYDSECHLKMFECKLQKHLSRANFEKCRTSTTLRQSATTSPVRRSTEYQNYDKITKQISLINELINTRPTIPTVEETRLGLSDGYLFDGDSYAKLATLKAYSKVSIRITLTAFAPDGVILYNGQTSQGDGDYIAILLKNSFVELRFNLGSGSVVLKSPSPIQLGKSFVIEVNRHLSEAHLSVDLQDNVTGKSEGPHKLLDLGDNLFVGGTPYSNVKKISSVLAMRKNFTGCIGSFVVNQQAISLENDALEDSAKIVKSGTCDTKGCSKLFCKNDATCELEDSRFICSCHDEFTGLQCESKQCSKQKCHDEFKDDSILDFWNNSYIQLPTLANVSQAFVIEIWFMSRAPNGLLMYNSQSRGDFIRLSLNDSFVYFDYNLGGKQNDQSIVSIRSSSPLTLGDWHRVVISRKLKEGSLQVNDEPKIEDKARGNLFELNLDKPLFLGGVSKDQTDGLPFQAFNGAIQRIVVNGNIWRNIPNKATRLENIQEFEGPPCGYDSPCGSHAKCHPWCKLHSSCNLSPKLIEFKVNDYFCECDAEYQGLKCQHDIKSTMSSVSIVNGSQVAWSDGDFPLISRSHNRIEVKFRTKEESGLLLWVSQQSDYLALVIDEGHLEFSFDLGKQSQYLSIRSTVRVNDGQTHHAIVLRDKQIGILELDARYMISGMSEEGATILNTDDKLWIGGSDNLRENLTKSYYAKFQGCIGLLRVEGTLIMNETNKLLGCSNLSI